MVNIATLAIYSIICLHSVIIFAKQRLKKLTEKAALWLLSISVIGDSNTSLKICLSHEGDQKAKSRK